MSDYPKYPPIIDDDLLDEFEKMLEETAEPKKVAEEKPNRWEGVEKLMNGRDLPYKCKHEWKSVQLVFSSVNVCKLCGEKE